MFTTVADYMLAQRMKKVLVKDDAKYRRAPPAHAVNQVVEIWWRRRVESQPPTPHMREVQQLEWWTTEVTADVCGGQRGDHGRVHIPLSITVRRVMVRLRAIKAASSLRKASRTTRL